jgi:hypothetical protein
LLSRQLPKKSTWELPWLIGHWQDPVMASVC